ncbi:MAG: exonuclease SbcCD subunit D, partial [Planctomycetota bacterium JB042]
MVRFLHTSDWQIGMRGGGLGRAAPEVRKKRLEAVERLLEVAAERECAFVVAAGDLFEHHGVDQTQVEEVARRIRAFPRLDVHVVPGNHDLPGPGAIWNRAALRNLPNLRVLSAEGPVALDGLDVTLWPFPVRSKHARTDPLAAAEVVADRPGVHVAIAHGHLTSVTFGGHEVDVKLPLDPAHVDRCGFDYLALGHWHGTRVFSAGDDAPRIAYSGTPEQTSYEEVDA